MSTTMEAIETVETERAAFEQWARKQWSAMTVEERADRFKEALSRLEDLWQGEDIGLALLAGGLFPLTFEPDQWREMIRAKVVDHLWYEWNKEQVVAAGLTGNDEDEIGMAAIHRMLNEYGELTATIEYGHEHSHGLNDIVTYYRHPMFDGT